MTPENPDPNTTESQWHDIWERIAFRTGEYTAEELETLRPKVDLLYQSAEVAPPDYVGLVDGPISGAYIAGICNGLLTRGLETPGINIAAAKCLELIVEKKKAHRAPMYDLVERVTGLRPDLDAPQPKKLTDKKLEMLFQELRGDMNRGPELRDGGNHWASGACMLSYYRVVKKLQYEEFKKYVHYETMAYYGPRFMHEKFCLVSKFPTVLKVDDRYRQHSATGPYQAWQDGVSLFYWHGTRVPEQWILDPKSCDPSIGLTWPDVEQRRCFVEIVGWTRVLENSPTRVVNQDSDPIIGTLLEIDLGDDEGRPGKFLRVAEGTGREFILRVPPHVQTALEGQAALREKALADFVLPTFRT